MPSPDTSARDYELREVLDVFRRDGSLIKEKARVLTEEGLERLYARMILDDLPTSAFLDIMKYLAEIGDLKPKQSKEPVNTGPGFSITINIPQPDGKPPIILEAESHRVEEDTGEVGLGDVPLKALKDLSGETPE